MQSGEALQHNVLTFPSSLSRSSCKDCSIAPTLWSNFVRLIRLSRARLSAFWKPRKRVEIKLPVKQSDKKWWKGESDLPHQSPFPHTPCPLSSLVDRPLESRVPREHAKRARSHKTHKTAVVSTERIFRLYAWQLNLTELGEVFIRKNESFRGERSGVSPAHTHFQKWTNHFKRTTYLHWVRHYGCYSKKIVYDKSPQL